MKCECGRNMEPYVVTVDEEQYVEQLCPRCAFPIILGPGLGPIHGRRLTLETIDNAMAHLRAQGRTGKTLITSPGTIKKLSEEFELLTRTVAPPSICKQLVSGGCVLDIKVDLTFLDDEAVIMDTADNSYPLIPVDKPLTSNVLARVTGSGQIIPVERFQLEQNFSQGVTTSLTTYGEVTASFTAREAAFIDPSDKLDIEVNGVDMGTFHIVSMRTSYTQRLGGQNVVTTEVELIGAK